MAPVNLQAQLNFPVFKYLIFVLFWLKTVPISQNWILPMSLFCRWIYEICGKKFLPEILLLKIWKNTPVFQKAIGQSYHLSALKNAQ